MNRFLFIRFPGAFLLAGLLCGTGAACPLPISLDEASGLPATEWAQNAAPSDPAPVKPATKSDDSAKKTQPDEPATAGLAESTKGNGGRVLGVLPNYRTTNLT